MVAFPDAGATGLIRYLGAYAILESLGSIALAFRVRSPHKDAEQVEQRIYGDAAGATSCSVRDRS